MIDKTAMHGTADSSRSSRLKCGEKRGSSASVLVACILEHWDSEHQYPLESITEVAMITRCRIWSPQPTVHSHDDPGSRD